MATLEEIIIIICNAIGGTSALLACGLVSYVLIKEYKEMKSQNKTEDR